MSQKIHSTFGQTMIQSFLKFWDNEKKLCIYSEDDLRSTDDRILIKKDFIHQDLVEKIKTFQTNIDKQKAAIKFSFKVFALYHALCNSEDYDYLIFLDADTEYVSGVRKNLAEFLVKNHLLAVHVDKVYTKGVAYDHYETGLLLINLKHEQIPILKNNLLKQYEDGSIFTLPEPYDGFMLKKLCETNFLDVLNLAKDNKSKSNTPFNNPELKRCMIHHMGKRKYNNAVFN